MEKVSKHAVREQAFLSRYKSESGIVGRLLFPNLLHTASIAAPAPGMGLKAENTPTSLTILLFLKGSSGCI